MNTRSSRMIALVTAVVVIAVVAAFVILELRPGSPSNGTTPLAAAEVRSYQGQDLSSISDVPENAIAGTQYLNESDYQLTVTGLTATTKVSTYREILDNHRHYSKVVTLDCVEGWSVTKITYEGIPLRALLASAGVRPEAGYVEFISGDGLYTDTLTLEQAAVEDVMVALLIDGKPIPSALGGPARLVVPQMYAYKSVKWLTAIRLIDKPKAGYWEERGYPADATIKGPKNG